MCLKLKRASLSAKALSGAILLLAVTGCASYTTPGAGISIENLSRADTDIADLLTVQPAAPFPARLAVARVQASGYYSRSTGCYGSGRYCVVTTRDIEPDASYEKLARLPQVAGLALMSRILLPEKLTSTRDLRRGAAALKTDMLLVYSVDTGFNVENTDVGPLALITLGFLPNKKARVTATASAALFDVRTGFVYGLAESSATEEQRATFWSSSEAVENARKKAESDAFQKLVDEVAKFWGDVLKTHAAPVPDGRHRGEHTDDTPWRELVDYHHHAIQSLIPGSDRSGQPEERTSSPPRLCPSAVKA